MKSSKKKDAKIVSANGLVEQGMKALSKLQPELAASFFERALSLEPDNTDIMDGYADILLQIGRMDEALHLLRRSTSLAPQDNCFKWFFLAQLLNGRDALVAYTAGIRYINELLSSTHDKSHVDSMKKQLAKAHVSIAELYLTDLCFEENAESLSENAVSNAFSVIPDLIDAKQTLASIRLSQNRPKDASDLMSAVFQQVMSVRQAIHSRTIMDELGNSENEIGELNSIYLTKVPTWPIFSQ
jgi:tetratricopeptide (TPR) repeat protein